MDKYRSDVADAGHFEWSDLTADFPGESALYLRSLPKFLFEPVGDSGPAIHAVHVETGQIVQRFRNLSEVASAYGGNFKRERDCWLVRRPEGFAPLNDAAGSRPEPLRHEFGRSLDVAAVRRLLDLPRAHLEGEARASKWLRGKLIDFAGSARSTVNLDNIGTWVDRHRAQEPILVGTSRRMQVEAARDLLSWGPAADFGLYVLYWEPTLVNAAELSREMSEHGHTHPTSSGEVDRVVRAVLRSSNGISWQFKVIFDGLPRRRTQTTAPSLPRSPVSPPARVLEWHESERTHLMTGRPVVGRGPSPLVG